MCICIPPAEDSRLCVDNFVFGKKKCYSLPPLFLSQRPIRERIASTPAIPGRDAKGARCPAGTPVVIATVVPVAVAGVSGATVVTSPSVYW
jgi:hypothetical protein